MKILSLSMVAVRIDLPQSLPVQQFSTATSWPTVFIPVGLH